MTGGAYIHTLFCCVFGKMPHFMGYGATIINVHTLDICNKFLSHIYIMFLFFLSITLIFVSIPHFLSKYMVVPLIVQQIVVQIIQVNCYPPRRASLLEPNHNERCVHIPHNFSEKP